SSASLPQAKPTPRRTATWLAWAIAATAVAALVAVNLGALRSSAVAPTEATEFAILAPDDTTFSTLVDTQTDRQLYALTLSPDGRRPGFAATGNDGVSRLWLRDLSSLAARPLNGTEDAEAPFWSPDGRSLGFFARRKLRRIDIAGGPPQAL